MPPQVQTLLSPAMAAWTPEARVWHKTHILMSTICLCDSCMEEETTCSLHLLFVFARCLQWKGPSLGHTTPDYNTDTVVGPSCVALCDSEHSEPPQISPGLMLRTWEGFPRLICSTPESTLR